MDEQRMRINEKIGDLLTDYGIDTSNTPMFDFVVDSTIQEILNFCALTKLPAELEHVVIRRALGQIILFNVQINGTDSINADRIVKSITEGDTSISYDNRLDKGMLIFAYVEESKKYGQDELYSFRKMRW